MEKVSWRQDGPVTLDGLPDGRLYDVRVRIRHGAADPEADVAKALGTILGKGRVIHYAGFKRAVAWRKTRWEVRASAGRRRATVHAADLKTNQLRDLMAAIQDIPGARDARLDARRRLHP